MGTPKLWSTIVFDASLWPQCAASVNTLLSLLERTLTRGGSHPLTMEVSVLESDPRYQSTLELLCRHASRWQDVYLYSDIDASKYLRCAKDQLIRLERL